MLTIAIQTNKYSGNSKCDLLIFIRHDYITLPLIFSVKKLCKITISSYICFEKNIHLYLSIFISKRNLEELTLLNSKGLSSKYKPLLITVSAAARRLSGHADSERLLCGGFSDTQNPPWSGLKVQNVLDIRCHWGGTFVILKRFFFMKCS